MYLEHHAFRTQEADTVSVLRVIADVLRSDADAFKNFSRIKWDLVENRYSPFMKRFGNVIEDAAKIQLTDVQISIIIDTYITSKGRFDYKRFLTDLLSQLGESGAGTVAGDFNSFNKFNSSAVFGRSANKKTSSPPDTGSRRQQSLRDIVLRKLTDSMFAHFPLRLEYYVDSFKTIGDMLEADFSRYLTSV
jgi:hypothetical protein